jgi:hypothetical protein
MKTYLEQAMEYEEQKALECRWRYPSLDAKWAVSRLMAQHDEATRRNIEVAGLMGPVVMRAMRG